MIHFPGSATSHSYNVFSVFLEYFTMPVRPVPPASQATKGATLTADAVRVVSSPAAVVSGQKETKCFSAAESCDSAAEEMVLA